MPSEKGQTVHALCEGAGLMGGCMQRPSAGWSVLYSLCVGCESLSVSFSKAGGGSQPAQGRR